METRLDIPKGLEGVGLELGVATGYYSDKILERSGLRRLFSIDRWSDHHDGAEYVAAVKRLARHGLRSVVLRMDFAEAAPLFPPGYFSFIYVDAYAHTGQQGGRLLEAWWPKLAEGGLFSGHDYHPRWPETMRAVDAFAARVGRPVAVVPGCSSDGNPENAYDSWIIRK